MGRRSDVARLEIPVSDAAFVGGGQTIDDRKGDWEQPLEFDPACGDDLVRPDYFCYTYYM